MYKVYFNRNLIVFTDKAPEGVPLVFNKMLLQQLGINIVKTLNPEENVTIYIVDDDVDACFSLFKELFTPISAAGGLVRNEQNDLLLIYRNNIWDLPKGKAELGESNEETAVREVSEECGIPEAQLHIAQFLDYSYHIYPLDNRWILKTTAWYVMDTDYMQPLTPQTEEGITRLQWVELKDLKEYVAEAYPLVINLIMTYLNQHS